MSKNLKNSILIIILLTFLNAMFLTITIAKENVPTNSNVEFKKNRVSSSEMMNVENTKSTLSSGYLAAFTIESLLFSLILSHLILSNFNQKSIKETYDNKNKIIIYVFLSVILTCVITYGNKIITEKYFITSSAKQFRHHSIAEHNNSQKLKFML